MRLNLIDGKSVLPNIFNYFDVFHPPCSDDQTDWSFITVWLGRGWGLVQLTNSVLSKCPHKCFAVLKFSQYMLGAVHLLCHTILASSGPPPTPLSYCVIVWLNPQENIQIKI